MPNLTLQNFTTMVQGMAAAVQGASTKLLNLTAGSVLRAIIEGTASVGLWLQYQTFLVLQATRLSTSNGTDVDTFVNDFGVARLPATYATGDATFSRLTATTAAFIPVGSTVLTSDQTQSFAVVVDTTNPAYVASPVAGYNLAAGTSSITIPVEAINAGTQGNVLAGTITLISSAIPGVDNVTNAAAFTNGENAESDAALKLRFQNFLSTRAEGTPGAVEYAVASVAANLTYALVENQTADGTYTPGTFVVTIDDGSGNTPSATVSTVAAAVEAVRPVGSTAVVQAASKLGATISMTISVSSGTKAAAQAAVNVAVPAFVNALPVGATLPYSRLAQVSYDAYSGISNVSALTLNGGTADLVPTSSEVVRVVSLAVN